MDPYYTGNLTREEWIMSNPTVIDYNHRRTQPAQPLPSTDPVPAPVQPIEISNDLQTLLKLQLEMLSNNITLPSSNTFDSSMTKLSSFVPPAPVQEATSAITKYNPFMEGDIEDDMDISDEENHSKNVNVQKKAATAPENPSSTFPAAVRQSTEINSGAAFYKGLILYIPPFEQLSQSYRGSPALKMLYASFEFSFKMPLRIETKPRENDPSISDAAVYYQDNIICMGSGSMPHVEASVRALELLSETCYTIQAKEHYFVKCKLVDAENMKTLNLKKWEAVSEKYPKIAEATKDSHIQKTFAVFLDNHTSTGIYEDIVCCNLSRQDVNNIKSVVEFFQLTMLPCPISTNLTKKNTPCVVSIHKYTSAKKLLDILVECGGENDKFKLHPPDTFKDFYKLHPCYWDPKLKKPGNKIEELQTTLDDPELHAFVMKPYKNIISELFEKHKTLPKMEKQVDNSNLRKVGDDFMKNTFQIDMAQSKNIAPVERMQLLLKYMEQLQEYGSRVLSSGRADMIKIYHNAIENVRKDLDTCRKDIEKEQKEKEKAVKTKATSDSHTSVRNRKSRSPVTRKRTPTRRRSRSPARYSRRANSRNRSTSPKHMPRSRSPRKRDRPRRSPSPRKRSRSRSPRKQRSKSPRRPLRLSPPRRARSPARSSPPRHARSPLRSSSPRHARSPLRRLSPRRSRSPQQFDSLSTEDSAFISIFKHQFKRYVDILRRFRIEIEDTPIDRKFTLKERLRSLNEHFIRFKNEVRENPSELGEYIYELDICRDELRVQEELINTSAALLMHLSERSLDKPPALTSYSLPGYGARVPPPDGLYD